MIIRSPSIWTRAVLSTSANHGAVFVGFRFSHQARTRQKHPKHNSADRRCSLYRVKITARTTAYKHVSGTLSRGQTDVNVNSRHCPQGKYRDNKPDERKA